MQKKSYKKITFSFLIAVFLIILDQVSKMIAQNTLKTNGPVVLIPNVFELHYLENTSAAFGMDPISLLNNIFHFSYFTNHPDALLSWKMGFFTIFTIAVILLLIVFFVRIPEAAKMNWANCAIILLISGAIGNLIDRTINQYVTDFFFFRLINFPIFNIADIYVVIGAAILIFIGAFYYKEEDFKMLFPSKRNKEDK